MAFEKIIPEENKKSKFWNPKTEGEYIEGNIAGDTKDQYGNRQIVLDRGSDENGNMQTTILPSHHNLRRYYNHINDGDYVRVTLVKIIPPKTEDKQPYRVYQMEVDPSRFKEYDNWL